MAALYVRNIADDCVVASEYTEDVLAEPFDGCPTGNPTLFGRLPIVKATQEAEILQIAKNIDRSEIIPSIWHQNDKLRPLNFMFLPSRNHRDPSISHNFALQSNHVHITPNYLLQNEIDTGSVVGKWIQANWAASKCIPPGVVFRLLQQKLETLEVKRKGYVLSDFPLIPATKIHDDLQALSVDEVQYFQTLNKYVIDKSMTDSDNDLTSFPTTCQSPQNGYDFFDTINMRWPTTENGLRRCIKNQFDFILQLSTQPDIIFRSDLQQCCDKDATDDDREWLAAMGQEFLLHYPMENVMAVDEAAPFVRWRFAFDVKSVADGQSTIVSKFPLKVSDFGARCPVAWKENLLRPGSDEFSVVYKGTIYALSSEKARTKFVKHPEFYVRLRPTCRLAIVGSKSTGKSTFANLLAHLLDGEVIPGSEVGKLQKVKNSRWILDGVPNDRTFWNQLCQVGCAPDIVLVLKDIKGCYWRTQAAKFRDKDLVMSHVYRHFKEILEPRQDLVAEPKSSESTDTLKTEIAACTIDEMLDIVCEVFKVDEPDEFDALKGYFVENGAEVVEVDVSDGTWSEVVIDGVSKCLTVFQDRPRDSEGAAVIFGEFGDFCPVALNDRKVLIKGRSNLHVVFRNKSYFLSDEGAKQRFMVRPQLYERPSTKIPPPRICIAGPPNAGKSSVALRMAEKYGIPIISRENLLENGPDYYFKEFPYANDGFIFDGTPETNDELVQMAQTGWLPEILVALHTEMEASEENWKNFYGKKIEVKASNSTELTWKRVEKLIERHMKRKTLLQTFRTVDLATADALIEAGMFVMSCFGRQCPVQNLEKLQRRFCFGSNDSEIQPIIYLDEIYFVKGKQRLRRFCEAPEKYTGATNTPLPQIKHRLIVLGPPNCGKTTIARRCAEKFGLKFVNTPDFDVLSLTGGVWVMDSPKLTDNLLQQLRECGHEPTAIVIITSSLKSLWKNVEKPKKSPAFVVDFAERFDDHLQDLKSLKTLRFKNVKYLNFSEAKWKMWHEVQNFILDTELGLWEYGHNILSGRPAALRHLNTSRYEFEAKMGTFRDYCPLCYINDGRLVRYEHFSEPDAERSVLGADDFHPNLVQWRQEMMWTCNGHFKEFLNLDKVPRKLLPADLPKLIEAKISNLRKRRRFCVVTGSRNDGEKVPGLEKYAVLYRKKIFLLATETAALEFLEKPQLYADYRFPTPPKPKFRGGLDEKGHNLLCQAIKECDHLRPKHRNLSVEESAAIFVGLFLKAHNPANNLWQKQLYEGALTRFTQTIFVRPKKRTFKSVDRKVCIVDPILASSIVTAVQPERTVINEFLNKTVDRTMMVADVHQLLGNMISNFKQ